MFRNCNCTIASIFRWMEESDQYREHERCQFQILKATLRKIVNKATYFKKFRIQ